jgi:chemotaxis protein CheY-P-specific phosphatase CheC
VTPMTARQEDALREVAHLGSAQAASMLARLVGDVGVLVDVPVVLSANRWQVGWLLGGRDVKVVASTFAVEGDLTGQVWWILKAPDADRVGRRLLSRPGVSGLLSTSVRAALAETANIVVSTCLSSVGTMVHATLVPSTPQVQEVTVAELVGPASNEGFRTVLAASFLATNTPTFGGWMVLLFEEATREEMLRRLGL